MRVIVELRTSVYIDDIMTESEWNKYVNQIHLINNHVSIYKLNEPNTLNCYEYIDLMFNGKITPISLKKAILKQTGNNPLYICLYINFLKTQQNISVMFQEQFIETMLKTFNFDEPIYLIIRLIEVYEKKNTNYRTLFILMNLFDGRLPLLYVQNLFGIYCESLLLELYRANIIIMINDITLGELISVKHELILNSIRNIDNFNLLFNRQIVQNALDDIDNIIFNNEMKDFYVVKINHLLSNHETTAKLGYILSKKFLKSGQYYFGCICGNWALEAVRNYDCFEIYNLLHINILETLIQLMFYTKEETDEVLNNMLNELEAIINLYDFSEPKDDSFYDLKLEFYLLLNKYNHYYGNFKNANKIINNAITFLTDNKNKISEEKIISACVEEAIAKKESLGLEAFKNSIIKALKLYPDSSYLIYTLNSAQYQLTCVNDPLKAQSYLLNNGKIETQLSIPEIYHNKVHMVNNLIYLRLYSKAEKEAINLIAETERRGLKNETGRIANILGILYWISGNNQKSHEFWEMGESVYSNSNYIPYLWPILINHMSLYIDNAQDM